MFCQYTAKNRVKALFLTVGPILAILKARINIAGMF